MSAIRRELSADLPRNIAERFEFHANNIYGSPDPENNSPLYARLCLAASADPEILALLANADFATQITNLLFAAVQFLLLGGTPHSLAAFYPNLTPIPQPIEDAYPHFRAFCIEHADEIRELVETRRVQTNEVGRCTGLVPAFNVVAKRAEGKPLALVEVGTSAGLHLLWDYYGYHYDHGIYIGSASSPVQLTCKMNGSHQLLLASGFPLVASRTGLELHPIDIHNKDDIRWLQALIWPEHQARHQHLQAALTVAQQHSLKIIAGNATDTLPTVLAEISDQTTLCVFHSYVFTQMPPTIRDQILAQLIAHSKQRDLFRLSQEWLDGWEKPRIELFTYHQGLVQSETLAYSESHGRWIEWLQ